MKLTNFLKVGAIALLLSLSLASCKKEDKKMSNEVSYNNKVTAIAKVEINLSAQNDGCYFFLNDGNGKQIMFIVFAPSLIGTKIDLSKADPYAEDPYNHHQYYVMFDDGDPEKWSDNTVYLWGGLDNNHLYADKGSYLLVKKIDENNYSIDLYATYDGYTLKVKYSGPVVEKELKF